MPAPDESERENELLDVEDDEEREARIRAYEK